MLMQTWIRKLFVSIIAVLTLGLYVPPALVDANESDENDTFIPSHSANGVAVAELPEQTVVEPTIIEQLTDKAIIQTKAKLGDRILHQVDDEFTAVILPKIEEVLESLFSDVDDTELATFQITENPAQGYGERIFNIYNYTANKTVAKFHVRRDYRPLEGYWFNFHYHLADDQFEKHYAIGDIFWDKNTPPKWMTH